MRTALDPTTYALMRDVAAGIRVLQSRDGVRLSESQILERARNIVMGLIGNYRIEAVAIDRGNDKRPQTDTDAIESATGSHVAAQAP